MSWIMFRPRTVILLLKKELLCHFKVNSFEKEKKRKEPVKIPLFIQDGVSPKPCHVLQVPL